MAYILALDQGTTSSRAILFDEAGTIAAVALFVKGRFKFLPTVKNPENGHYLARDFKGD